MRKSLLIISIILTSFILGCQHGISHKKIQPLKPLPQSLLRGEHPQTNIAPPTIKNTNGNINGKKALNNIQNTSKKDINQKGAERLIAKPEIVQQAQPPEQPQISEPPKIKIKVLPFILYYSVVSIVTIGLFFLYRKFKSP